MNTSVHLVVSGRVQGVCFRYYCRDQAIKFGVQGWVRNLSDGSVEITAEGDKEQVRRFADWCRQGPPHAVVTDCHETYAPATGKFDSFEIRF